MSKIPVALQLYTVRDETARDFRRTVRKVAEMGYAGIELAGTGGLSAVQMRNLLAETGLRAAGSHIGLGTFEKELDQIIEYNLTIGNEFVGVPALPQEMRNPKGFRQAASSLNKIGAGLKESGLVLYYHNHAFEFEEMEDVRGIDIIYGETDPDLVKLQPDVYWIYYAGEDPATLIRGHAGRFPLIHLKDMTGKGEERTFAEVGEGVIDFAPIFAASEAQDAQWYIVEQDRCARPSLESAQISLENLKGWGKV